MSQKNESAPHDSTAKLQKPAPDFSGTAVVKGEFKQIKLSEYKGKYILLLFYPVDFVCPAEIIAFSDMYNDFKNINCEVIAASCDSQYTHLAWINKSRKDGGLGEINLPLLSDKSMKIAAAYGILCEETGTPFCGMFIIDDNGILRTSNVNDIQVERSVTEALRLVRAFQSIEVSEEDCPHCS